MRPAHAERLVEPVDDLASARAAASPRFDDAAFDADTIRPNAGRPAAPRLRAAMADLGDQVLAGPRI